MTDAYKISHIFMLPPGQTLVYSNFIPRKSRLSDIDYAVVYGIQYFIKEFLIDRFNNDFFNKDWEHISTELSTFFYHYFGANEISLEPFRELHKLGYLPLKIKALPEGSKCPLRVPFMTIYNTHPDFAWLTNYIETIAQNVIWHPITVATKTHRLRQILDKWADKTSSRPEFVDFQAHTFSMRGCSGPESSISVDSAHLLFFKGSDTLPGNLFHQHYYNADPFNGLISTSVRANEHAIATSGGPEGEFKEFERLIDLFPNGILSLISDSFDLTEVINPDNGFLVRLKDKIMKRNGTLVIRPDSSDKTPLEIICGDPEPHPKYSQRQRRVIQKGLVRCLDEIFGSTFNSKGYRELDSHISYIYGECISQDLLENICSKLENMKYASTNGVYGVGSWEHIGGLTRDSLGLACKASYNEYTINDDAGGYAPDRMTTIKRNIYKNPITDSGEKKSPKGLLKVNEDYTLKEECSWEEENTGLLETVFHNGELWKDQSLAEIRERVAKC